MLAQSFFSFSSAFPSDVDMASGEVLNPDSPTASTFVTRPDELTCMTKRHLPRRRSTASRVSFAPASKSWDGLRCSSLVVDALVTRYFVRQQECSELDVLDIASADLAVVDQLVLDLHDLALRIELAVSNGLVSEPVLPEGGGSNVKLSLAHLPYVRILIRVVVAAQARLASAQQLQRQQQNQASC